MRDPFPIPPIQALSDWIEPYATAWGMYTLPLHIHEILFAALFYTFIQLVFSPWISTLLFRAYYPAHHRGRKVSWDAHIVSLVQSSLINVLALWCMWADRERSAMDWQQRVWGYTGAQGLIQSMAAGYFLWDLVVTILHIDVFGVGLLAHASSALVVYSFGFVSRLSSLLFIFLDTLNTRNPKAGVMTAFCNDRDPSSTTTAAPSSSTSSPPPSSTSTGSSTSST